MKKAIWGACLLVLAMPTMAAITIDSNGIRINTSDKNEVDNWKKKHQQDCSSLKIGDVTIKSDGCQSDEWKKGKSKENRSVHGDNNPGKGHDKSKSGKQK
ncbi:MAG: hypothetical protein ACRCRW_15170 [Aeromonadaceae bacterium]